MYSEAEIESAVAAGAITPDAASRLRDHISRERAGLPADEEHFRLLTGFNDIFVALAAVILLVAVGWLAQQIPPRIEDVGPSPFAGFFVAATAWGLAEFFTRKRRMALPSIILLLAFVGGIFATVGISGALLVIETVGPNVGDQVGDAMARTLASAVLIASGAAAAAAAWIHWRRFKVPITVAAGTAAIAALVVGLVAIAVGDQEGIRDIVLTVVLLLGLGVFAFAMWWDASDVKRETRRSDVAFWLHLLAAPMIVHPVFTLLGLTEGGAGAGVGAAAIVIALYILLGLAAVAVDRRALLVSALAYVLWALNDLFRTAGAVELSLALTALVIGSALLMLSAFWPQTRRVILTPLPERMRSRLAPVDRVALSA
jgi:hypothetical protein